MTDAKEVECSKTGAFELIGGNLRASSHSCSLKSASHLMTSQLESFNKFLPGLIMIPMLKCWLDGLHVKPLRTYDKLLVIFYRNLMKIISHFIKVIEEYRYLTLSMGHGHFGSLWGHITLLKLLEAWGLTEISNCSILRWNIDNLFLVPPPFPFGGGV